MTAINQSRPLGRVGLLGGLLALLVASGCSEEEKSSVDLLPSVSVHVIEPRTLAEEIRASGDLKARFHTEIAAEVDGRVTELSIDEGGSVEAGQVVIEIDPQRRALDLRAAEARLAQARANLRQQKSETRRIRELHSQRVASIQQLEKADTALALAESAVRAEQAAVGVARRAVEDSSVSAPFAGTVARRSVELGEFVQTGKSLFELVALDKLEATFSLTELDTERVRLGQRVAISVGAFPNRRFEGTVTFISPTVDPATRTLRIKAEVDNPQGALRPGLFARVNLGVATRENVLMVPAEALIQRASGVSVYRVVASAEEAEGEGRVERITVEAGASDGGMVEIRGEVRPGDQIVRRGHGGLADGMSVAVQGASPAPLAGALDKDAGGDS